MKYKDFYKHLFENISSDEDVKYIELESLYKNGDEKALEEADNCLKIKPDYSHGYLRKGRALLRLDRFDEAIQAFKKAIELEPKNDKFKEW